MSAYRSKFRILSTGFRYPESRLFYGRASLYFDRIELGGFGLGGRRFAAIPLDEVSHFETTSGGSDILTLGLKNGKTVELVFNDPAIWESYLKSRLAWRNRLEQPPISTQEQTFMLDDTSGRSVSIS